MPRTADYTIQGFLYQFNKTALEILRAQDDDTITVEGIVEDIEVSSTSSLTAIQCKYHEASTSFTESTVYKPLLQMLKHFSDNQMADIRYILFAHFPGADTSPPTVDKSTMQAALASTDRTLQSHIKAIPSIIDLDSFIEHFAMEFGPSYNDIVKQVTKELETSGMLVDDIETLAYPNAIHMIATLSVKHDPSDRQITKKQFLYDLRTIRTTAISRWTLALKTRKKLLEARRKQLKVHLDVNSRLRYFVIEPSSIEDYDTEIVIFFADFIDKYHFKPAHISTPVLCLCANREHIQGIQRRLFAKDIVAEDGYIGGEFQESRFFREPMFSKKTGAIMQREFSIRLLSWEDHGEVLNNRKCDDLFVIGEPNCITLETIDVNVESLIDVTIKEVKYVMGVSNVLE